ncbi:MAG: cobalt ECF transporter T component CbiQ [Candidatus Lindowbacteria bacterium RIFCSPLOWO2_12_FULL_62_27]|nr:MAG: cobalt ECF transporter T component CbiQ [Candidatus Lindowbacteria bacterium RIFCSPLOWO2_02_FULL_62_12]OGH59002.1 MAG: cobalt ECF transporter T component CbiQ [Candidatus Lindowbacteria bacterium RIFCSPLOWO2_12_FULL_62_27]
MSGKLSLRDYLEIEEHLFAAPPKGWRSAGAGLKMFLAVTAVAANVTVAKLPVSLLLFAVAGILLIGSRIPRRQFLLFFLAPAWATLVVVIGFSFGFGATPIWSFGPLTAYREGLREGIAAAARVACDMAWMAALFLTTPFTEQIAVLRKIRVPGVLVDTLAFMYRYVFLLWDEFDRMWTAAKARGGMSNRARRIDTTSRLAAQIFLQAYDRAERIDLSIRARGGVS